MQLISVYLYPNKVEAYTNAFSDWTNERYRRVYNDNLKVYRGVDNRVDFQIRNASEKVQAIPGTVVVFSLSNKETGELILQKDCTVQSTQTGKIFVTLLETEMRSIEPGQYTYCLHSEIRTAINGSDYIVSSKKPLYIDSQYGVNANVDIYGDVFGEVQPSYETVAFEERIAFDLDALSTFYSSIIPAKPELTTPQSVHTFQFNMTEYYGQVVVEASQEDSSDPGVWVDVATLDSAGRNILYQTVIGKFNWFRIRHTPSLTTALARFTIQQTILLDYDVSIGERGFGYRVGDNITFNGSALGGETPTNNLVITVTQVGSRGEILDFIWAGASYNGVRTFVLTDPALSFGSVDKVYYR
jgi:hypothetical protein